MSIIEARDLTKKYKSLTAVDSIDFEIEAGECFGFLGPNGAGKTTVMGILYCFMPPSSGEVMVFDLDVVKYPERIKARLGVMPQDNNLDPDLSVYENLIVYARYFDIPRDVSSVRAASLLEFTELTEKANVNIKELSGGMQRRLLLARALMNEPSMIILDEPTTGLDPHSRHHVWDQLSRLKSEGITLLLTTHYMDEAEKMCDRVAIMDAGKIITIDTPARLMDIYKGNLEHVYMKLTGKNLNG
jgi:lipooligosaccharide transport system ATP-binding protein